ncbi:MAG: alkyl sulfatase dimerization domain-containing protein [Hyphomicrobiaceae bacterium]|nr:alkyl sulfatase dimerization domain-containing protein [Hyphomicrobiaceae bacterium]
MSQATLVALGMAAGLAVGAALWRPKAAAFKAAPPSNAAEAVRLVHRASAHGVDLEEPSAFADARRGFIARPTGKVLGAAGNVIWDFDATAFVTGAAPATVNPSLWRQARLNGHAGLFKVRDGVWQLRGFDLANMTLIEGRTGWIVVDTLTARETAAAALAFARRHLGDRKVSAVIFTHSHVDHFGGVLGVITAEEARARQVPIVAPAGFMEEATSENVMMGAAMGRRAMLMYGSRLPRNEKGLVDNGLGQAVAIGEVGVLKPTIVVEAMRQELEIDGRRLVFHNVPGSEAPSEFVFEIPELKAFCGAEMLSHTLHNLYTLRGAKVRDALKWADYIDRSLAFVRDAEVVFNQHHWPVWGQARIRDFMEKQRDVYRFIHDQTVRQMNGGRTAPEIAETLELPKALSEHLSVRGYYGTVRHNVKAVYQHYLGWFDANPANLDPLPPLEAARGYIALAGGAENVMAAAQRAYEAGAFRWAAEILKHVVYAEPQRTEALELQARAFEQMGYMAESGPWRNFYLTGALELREGPPQKGVSLELARDLLQHTPVERFLERMAASLNGAKAAEAATTINIVLPDIAESYVLKVENAVLHHRKAPPAADAEATLRITKPLFLRLMTGQAGAVDLATSSEAQVEGSKLALAKFFLLFDKAPGTFPIVTR